jgi:hypothetical protein
VSFSQHKDKFVIAVQKNASRAVKKGLKLPKVWPVAGWILCGISFFGVGNYFFAL